MTKSKNNFDGMRIALTLIVIFAHFFAITRIPQFEIFWKYLDSNYALKGFFAISGFLVMKSYLGSRGILDFAEKRFRRVYPAYITAILLCILIGFIGTQLSSAEFWQSEETLKYLISNALFLNFLQPSLPGAFLHNPMQALNGSLWTVKIEIILYCCIPFIWLAFKKIGSSTSTLLVILLSILWVYFFTYAYTGDKGLIIARQFPGQLSYFIFGALLSVNERLFSNLKWIAAISLILHLLITNPYARLFIDPICYTSVIIYLSSQAFSHINFGRYGDVSFGLFLYHFPIIQLFLFLGVFSVNVWLGLSATLLVTLILSLLSWHLIEKRALKRGSHYVVSAERLETEGE